MSRSLLPSIMAALLTLLVTAAAQSEIQYSDKEFNQLDQFEAHSLGKADKVFLDKDYTRAAAEYDAFIMEFPRSVALPYAILRKARCQHLSNKRYNAIKSYTEVLDYFPNSIAFAAAALYYTGLAHADNGEEDKAMKAWAEMADDEDYSQEPLAAHAINRLAAYLVDKQQLSKANDYYWQVARDFRKTNHDAANQAIDKVIHYHIRIKPDIDKLKAFYADVQGFENRPIEVPDDFADDTRFWDKIRHHVKRFDDYNDVQAGQRRAYYEYWAKAMDGRFPKWDDYQIDLARFTFYANGNKDQLHQRLDKQFTDYRQEGEFDRVITWMGLFAGNPDKVKEYYAKLDFQKMTNPQIITVIQFFFDRLKDQELARNAFDKLKMSDMTDDEKQRFGRWLWHKDEQLVERISRHFENSDYGKLELLRYYHWKRNLQAGMPLADDLINVPDYAKEALTKKADMLFWSSKFRDAIPFYQQSDNPPESIFSVSQCYEKLGELEAAVNQMRQVENFFSDQAGSRAALRIAHLYRAAEKHDQYVAALRRVMTKYPKAKESSVAHQELEKLGERIGGGVHAE